MAMCDPGQVIAFLWATVSLLAIGRVDRDHLGTLIQSFIQQMLIASGDKVGERNR